MDKLIFLRSGELVVDSTLQVWNLGNGSEADEFDGRQSCNKYRGLTRSSVLSSNLIRCRSGQSLQFSSNDTDADGLSDLEESHLGTFAILLIVTVMVLTARRLRVFIPMNMLRKFTCWKHDRTESRGAFSHDYQCRGKCICLCRSSRIGECLVGRARCRL